MPSWTAEADRALLLCALKQTDFVTSKAFWDIAAKEVGSEFTPLACKCVECDRFVTIGDRQLTTVPCRGRWATLKKATKDGNAPETPAG